MAPLRLNYRGSGNPLQTLDLWLPRPSISGSEPVFFCVYIHGGAWTDPRQEASEGWPILEHLYAAGPIEGCKIACASINYRLSTPQSGVRHPMHMNDVDAALDFLKRHYGLAHCILIGHSCGATLAVQMFPKHRREVMGMILFNGIYDLIPLAMEYPAYTGFLVAAFGKIPPATDAKGRPVPTAERIRVWTSASAKNVLLENHTRREHLHELIVLAHSAEDELLSMSQTDAFHAFLNTIWGEPIQRELIHGKHDDSPHGEEMRRISLEATRKIAIKLCANYAEEAAAVRRQSSSNKLQIIPALASLALESIFGQAQEQKQEQVRKQEQDQKHQQEQKQEQDQKQEQVHEQEQQQSDSDP